MRSYSACLIVKTTCPIAEYSDYRMEEHHGHIDSSRQAILFVKLEAE